MENIRQIIEDVAKNFEKNYSSQSLYKGNMPQRSEIIDLINEIRRLMFPGYFGTENTSLVAFGSFAGNTVACVYEDMLKQIRIALSHSSVSENTDDEAEKKTIEFIKALPHVQELLIKDVEAGFEGDPAAKSREDIVFCYPGIYAIFVYRIAHILYQLDIPFIPRIMTEHAHGKTGIDINPGADIGEYFFIDHGTGIVVGETTKIGNHVKIYQGVTLGALSTREGQALSGVKRHPTIEDNVVIYANTTILGGETIVGCNSVVAGNSFITESIPPNTKVSVAMPELRIKNM